MFNPNPAAGCLASNANATTATHRQQLITISGRLAQFGRRMVVNPPSDWLWERPGPSCSLPLKGPLPPPPHHPPRHSPIREIRWRNRTDQKLATPLTRLRPKNHQSAPKHTGSDDPSFQDKTRISAQSHELLHQRLTTIDCEVPHCVRGWVRTGAGERSEPLPIL